MNAVFIALSLQAGSCVEHIPAKSNVLFYNADLSCNNITKMNTCFEIRNEAIVFLIPAFLLLHGLAHIKIAFDTLALINTIFHFPCNNYLVSHILVNLSFIVNNGICNVGKKIFQQVMISFIAKGFSNRSRRLYVNKHEDPFFLLRKMIFSFNKIP